MTLVTTAWTGPKSLLLCGKQQNVSFNRDKNKRFYYFCLKWFLFKDDISEKWSGVTLVCTKWTALTTLCLWHICIYLALKWFHDPESHYILPARKKDPPKNTDVTYFTLTNVICFKFQYSLMQPCSHRVTVAYLFIYSGLLS